MAGNNENTSAQESTKNSLFINFDNYSSAPLSTHYTPPLLNTWTFNSSGFLVLPDWASAWKDKGFQLPPDFDWISSKRIPQITYHDSSQLNRLKLAPPLEQNNDMNSDSFLDVGRKPVSMGAYSMLDEAGTALKTKQSYSVFVCGKTRADNFIKLNIEEDHHPLA